MRRRLFMLFIAIQRMEYALSDKPGFEVDASRLIWRFFAAHPRGRQ